jgi:hypothetical protein
MEGMVFFYVPEFKKYLFEDNVIAVYVQLFPCPNYKNSKRFSFA